MSLLTQEDDPRVTDLRGRLDQYYSEADDYLAFEAVNSKPAYWGPIRVRIQEVLGKRGTCRILEVGAGKSGFPLGLGKIRSKVRYCAQDVTDQNQEHLLSVSDEVYVGDVSSIDERFDVIFSTFVFEHITTPRATLERQLELLEPGGSLIVACPRYGFPLYVPPSARHYGFVARAGVMCSFLWKRLIGMATGRSMFLVHVDPSLFHGHRYIDADAVYWPSLSDFRRALPRDCSIRQLTLEEGSGLKAWIYRACLLLFIEIRKAG